MGKEYDEDDRPQAADLSGLKADAASELEQEEAERRADASARTAAAASAARLDFEARQKAQAKEDAEYDRARQQRDEADEEAYGHLLAAEAEANDQADEDARAAGREVNRGTEHPADGTVSPEVANEAVDGEPEPQQVTQLPAGQYEVEDCDEGTRDATLD